MKRPPFNIDYVYSQISEVKNVMAECKHGSVRWEIHYLYWQYLKKLVAKSKGGNEDE
jgi:hypothetical protein